MKQPLRSEICVSIADIPYDSLIRIIGDFSLAEIRLDRLALSADQIEELFATHPNLIATCRDSGLSGNRVADALLRSLRAGAARVDIDIDLPADIADEVKRVATSTGAGLIVSYHNFDTTPDTSELHRIADRLFAFGADWAKIACMAHAPADCARIMGMYDGTSKLIAFCMGEVGRVTRYAAPLLGAPFTYASIPGMPVAPGQVDYISVDNFLSNLSKP